MQRRRKILSPEAYYDFISPQYDSMFIDPVSRAEDAVVKAILDRTIRAGGSLLDCGCGTGLGRAMTADIADDYLGIDISEAMVMRARRNHRLNHRGEAMFLTADMTRLDFLADGSFDCVISLNGAFSHVRDGRAAAAEMTRVLRPGGALLVMVYSRYALSRLRRFWRNGLCSGEGPYAVRHAHRDCTSWARFYTPRELKDCFGALAEVNTIPLNILPDNFCRRSRDMRRLIALMAFETRLPAFLHGLGHALILTGIKR
ncbi:class I SAM-dependent methyltransferase [Mesorhizobium sp. RMAD-H1]|uniref:class I SAM-dependent methyltransferase n=1 Tax=Mesorhizobium sp. RMAD-H1 TaxID=2587065 RepID=UPI001619B045|nr:class I SAM-dependent methyltransferase [Mesorhizobium sp. RMAD-H1]MBB2973347.1 ubiquinone/menaquinone biosynthesis C-methylase UbiE [Mesorhizobium sp. RMAD-H1]